MGSETKKRASSRFGTGAGEPEHMVILGIATMLHELPRHGVQAEPLGALRSGNCGFHFIRESTLHTARIRGGRDIIISFPAKDCAVRICSAGIKRRVDLSVGPT